MNKRADVTRIYLPPDVNSLLSVADHCLRSQNDINVIISDKQLHMQYLDMPAAIEHCTKGVGIWEWTSNDQGCEPDLVMCSAGDIPTQEALAATALLRAEFHDLKIRYINMIDLFKLEPNSEPPHGLSDKDFDSLFTADKPIIFNFHGYPWLIHRLAYRPPITRTCTYAATTSEATSIRQWNWRSTTRSIDSVWPSMRSIEFQSCKDGWARQRRNFAIGRLRAVPMRINTALTRRILRVGVGLQCEMARSPAYARARRS